MAKGDLDSLFDLWARWVLNGCNARGGFASMLQMMMATRCQFSGGGGEPNDSLETSIEGAVALLSTTDKNSATVLRVEYGVLTLVGEPKTQLDKAAAMGINVKTYRRRLDKGRAFVADYLIERKKRK